jgi:adenosylcobalamin-dependent ribonucleoside-triphosphate reductase
MSFKLPTWFIKKFLKEAPNYGFGALSQITCLRTYSRLNEYGVNETWPEIVQRVVEWAYEMQLAHLESFGLTSTWDEEKALKSAMEMYERIFNFKFLPAGRSLYAAGTPITRKKLHAALNSCAFVSTKDIDKSVAPFEFLMDLSMLGIGVGFDCKGDGKVIIRTPQDSDFVYKIDDSREGWVKSVRLLLKSYFYGEDRVEFDYSDIRPKGSPLETFGGVAAGPGPLMKLHETLEEDFENNIGKTITTTDIVNIHNRIGKCVIVGNIRRTAEIALSPIDNKEFLDLKNYKKNPDRADFGWASNNSVFCEMGSDYGLIWDGIVNNGEPGLAWLDNMREYSRMNGVKDYKDIKAEGCNPCVEQTLENYEVCCLIETFPHHHDTLEDYLRTLKYAFLYGKSVTLGKTHWKETNEKIEKNRRVGVSMSGITQFLANNNTEILRNWCETGYDKVQEYDEQFSNFLGVNRSIKTTSVKPSGTVSLLAGATPGLHFAESKYYIRRMRIPKNSNLIPKLKKAGYPMETDKTDPNNYVVDFPIKIEEDIKTNKEVSMWEKLHLAAFMQRYWSDNQVSATITFNRKTEGHQIQAALDYFQYLLKGVSFLPYDDDDTETTPYEQMPYEEITEERYKTMMSNIDQNFDFGIDLGEDAEDTDKYCSNDNCLI